MSDLTTYRKVIGRAKDAYDEFLKGSASNKTLLDKNRPEEQVLLNEYTSEKKIFDSVFPLDSELKDQLEHLFSADLSGVKIHTGAYAEEITRNANAQAITMGHDIYFGSGRYAPYTDEGFKLLAHELQHTIQNKKGDRFVYLEDFEEAENSSEDIEEILNNVKPHLITAPILGATGVQVGASDMASQVGNAGADIFKSDTDSGGSLGKFASRSDKDVISYTLLSGEVVHMSPLEYQNMIEDIALELKEEISDKESLLSTEEFESYLIRTMEFCNVHKI